MAALLVIPVAFRAKVFFIKLFLFIVLVVDILYFKVLFILNEQENYQLKKTLE